MITVLQQAQVETLVLERYGAAARRILRILFESKFLEQKQIAQLAMVPVNDARSKLYALLSAGFLQLQVRRCGGPVWSFSRPNARVSS